MKSRAVLFTMLSALVTVGLLSGCAGQPAAGAAEPAKEQAVNLYSARNYAIDDVLFAQFTQKTGIKVNVVKGSAEELIERLKREGQSSPADLFLTVDGGVLNNAKEHGVLQPVSSPVIDQNVPKQLRDQENYWVGLATRARVVAYAQDRVNPEQLATYEDLATGTWKGKVLVRSSASLYNQSLLASMVELGGEQAATDWAEGIVKNMSRKPEGGDRDQIKAIAAGVGDVAIINTYYYGQMLASKDVEEVKAAQRVAIVFPNQKTTGTHVNISGVGLAKYAQHQANALKFIEYMTGAEAQTVIAKENFEFPVNAKADKPELFKTWGDFKAQQIDFAKLGVQNKKALEILTKVNWK